MKEEETAREVAETIRRIEDRVESSLGKVVLPMQPVMSKTAAWVFCMLVLMLQIAVLAIYFIDATDRDNRRNDTMKHQQFMENQSVGIACLLMAPNPAGTRTVQDAARCEVDYIPGPGVYEHGR